MCGFPSRRFQCHTGILLNFGMNDLPQNRKGSTTKWIQFAQSREIVLFHPTHILTWQGEFELLDSAYYNINIYTILILERI